MLHGKIQQHPQEESCNLSDVCLQGQASRLSAIMLVVDAGAQVALMLAAAAAAAACLAVWQLLATLLHLGIASLL